MIITQETSILLVIHVHSERLCHSISWEEKKFPITKVDVCHTNLRIVLQTHTVRFTYWLFFDDEIALKTEQTVKYLFC